MIGENVRSLTLPEAGSIDASIGAGSGFSLEFGSSGLGSFSKTTEKVRSVLDVVGI
jgi:hypothetical protein